jgi:Na+/alanine symporter
MFRLLFDGKSSESGVSSFQALAMSLAGRVGTGNIAGVATAVAFGVLELCFGCGWLHSLELAQHL